MKTIWTSGFDGLDARIALAYEKCQLTNKFDPRQFRPAFKELSHNENLSVLDSAQIEGEQDKRIEDRELETQVLTVRDTMIRMLRSDLASLALPI